ncbi:MAG: hypothetical protein V1492_04660 [Candidatus Micrarchaeota archaeon]
MAGNKLKRSENVVNVCDIKPGSELWEKKGEQIVRVRLNGALKKIKSALEKRFNREFTDREIIETIRKIRNTPMYTEDPSYVKKWEKGEENKIKLLIATALFASGECSNPERQANKVLELLTKVIDEDDRVPSADKKELVLAIMKRENEFISTSETHKLITVVIEEEVHKNMIRKGLYNPK